VRDDIFRAHGVFRRDARTGKRHADRLLDCGQYLGRKDLPLAPAVREKMLADLRAI